MANEHGIYQYEPSTMAAIVSAGLFGVGALVHLIVMYRKKTWYYTPLVVGAFMMAAGYGFRIPSANKPSDIMLYAIQSLFTILPPSLYAASIYMIFGRIILFVKSPSASIIAPHKITKIFVIGDLFSFLLQAGGGGVMAVPSMADMGQKVSIIGLVIQLIFLALFLAVALIFWKRMRSSPARNTNSSGSRTWQALFALLLFVSVIIVLRCVFRLIEFAQGHDGALMSKEIYLYVFDTIPMFIVQSAFHFVHASDVFEGAELGFMKQTSEDDLPLRTYG
ncbi:Protein RTA1 [Paramyrothecium foliicola]|nr:Protein RTA1 [Paramyrothecium foliicola]